MLNLSVTMQCQVIQALQLCGGTTQSLFPAAEAWLMDSADHAEALKYVAGRKNINRYKSVMDFLFCELFTIFRTACFRYYRDAGPQLREMITPEQVVFFNNALLKALELAYEHHDQQRRISWTQFRQEALKRAA